MNVDRQQTRHGEVAPSAPGQSLLSEAERPSKEHFRILLLSWAGWVFDFYDLILYTFLLIPIGKELHLSDIELSYVLGGSLTATAVGGVVFGFLSDRFGRKNVLQWTILTYSVGTFLCGFATNLQWLILFRAITGLGVGGEWATGQTYVCETFPPKVRGRYGALMQTGAPIGIALASVVGGFLMPVIGWRGCFFVSLLPALLLAFMFLVGFGTGMFGGYGPLFSELFPTNIGNTAMGSAFNLARGVQFFTPVIIAVIAKHYGLAGGISLAALFALLTGLWIWVFPETKGRDLSGSLSLQKLQTHGRGRLTP